MFNYVYSKKFTNIFISLSLISILPASVKSQSPEIQAGFGFTQPGIYTVESKITQQEWEGPSPSHEWRGKIWRLINTFQPNEQAQLISFKNYGFEYFDREKKYLAFISPVNFNKDEVAYIFIHDFNKKPGYLQLKQAVSVTEANYFSPLALENFILEGKIPSALELGIHKDLLAIHLYFASSAQPDTPPKLPKPATTPQRADPKPGASNYLSPLALQQLVEEKQRDALNKHYQDIEHIYNIKQAYRQMVLRLLQEEKQLGTLELEAEIIKVKKLEKFSLY